MITTNQVKNLKEKFQTILGVEAKTTGEAKDGSAKSVKATINGSIDGRKLCQLAKDVPYKHTLRRSGKSVTITFKAN
mgnify:CR=1 FL=1